MQTTDRNYLLALALILSAALSAAASAADRMSGVTPTPTPHKPKEIVVVGADAPKAQTLPGRTPVQPPVGAKPVPGALPELPGFQKKPDLVPILLVPMSAKVAVKNLGPGHAAPSVLTIECNRRGRRGGCAESRDMARYTHPAYPEKVVVHVPALSPGQTWSHELAFWKNLKWEAGTYGFTAIADDGNAVAEHNEGNNVMHSSLTVP